ncbi:MAG: rRNA pseudouridine synthase [Clostridia bacterium]|nr:rRNA pseudouridine synthase [Clostridia bacterium]
MRLDRFISGNSALSRKEVSSSARKGMITVNGQPATDPGMHIDPEKDTVCVGGERINYSRFVYIMMNKPAGLVSSTEDRERTVISLLPEWVAALGVFPCGRLDKDTTGLLVITNDGATAHNLLSPRHHVPKTYRFSLALPLSEEQRVRLAEGVDIGDKKPTSPSDIVLDEGMMSGEITITEGKFHQIKRMFAAVSNRVTGLERTRFGSLELDPELERGEWRYLNENEIASLRGDAGTEN